MTREHECLQCKSGLNLIYIGTLKTTAGVEEVYACKLHVKLVRNWYEAHA